MVVAPLDYLSSVQGVVKSLQNPVHAFKKRVRFIKLKLGIIMCNIIQSFVLLRNVFHFLLLVDPCYSMTCPENESCDIVDGTETGECKCGDQSSCASNKKCLYAKTGDVAVYQCRMYKNYLL